MNICSQKEAEAMPQHDEKLSQESALTMNETQLVLGGVHWYKHGFNRVLKLLFLSLGANIICAGTVVFLLCNPPKPTYFATSGDTILELIPLSKPVLTHNKLLDWTSGIIIEAVSLDFVKWRKQLSDLREYFSANAYASYLDSLETSGALAMVKEKRLSVSATKTGAPVIVASGIIDGKATWRIEFPLIVSYESSQGVESTQKLLATVLIARASTATTKHGVLIEQIVLKRNG